MKKILYIIGLFGIMTFVTSCNDDFMERYPETSITEGGFFKNVEDLKTYINGLYNDGNLMSGGYINDDESDDVTFKTSMGDTWQMLYGQLSVATASGWANWGSLRSVNFFLQNADKATGNEADINNYIGIARYMRAYFYIGKVQLYSDVPWTDKVLGSDDPDVYKVADSREFVVDKIMEDLEFAAVNISATMGNKTRIHKYSALALISRFCLYEGTYRKYHSELNLASSADRFLQRSLSASEEIMNSGLFSISMEGTPAEEFAAGGGIYISTAYRGLFQSQNLSGNPEVIQWSDYLYQKRANGADRVKGLDYGLTRAFIETYLMKDGQPFTSTAGYTTKTFGEIFKNRDPRMAETVSFPGFTAIGANNSMPTGGGYDQIKFYPRNAEWQQRGGGTWEAIVVYRYAEILLNYAEAKAELGTLTQADLDKTITLIRSRVDMPPLSMAAANAAPDAFLAGHHPNVSSANKGVILEIRRERRIELACEGFRLRDIYRWCNGELQAVHQQGIYIDKLGAYDVTGDDIPDVALLATADDESPIADLPDEVKENLTKIAVDGSKGIILEHGTYGHVLLEGDKNRVSWENPKFYYRPIPQTQITLNPELKQPFGW
ncbi:MAG: RagB/SusD family nutrient uptake outer membrane protein [Prevotellaceae bacterium]|jgi:hypothetical protein|nr:RagB/SusD family nutrient uptake outer membrane protein [Prevotellaceae bacterium]